MAGKNWNRLAKYVTAQRVRLGYETQRSFAEALDLSERTVSKLETGQSVGRNVIAKVENRLGWAPGSADDIMADRDPTLSADQRVGDRTDWGPELPDDIKAMLDEPWAQSLWPILDRYVPTQDEKYQTMRENAEKIRNATRIGEEFARRFIEPMTPEQLRKFRAVADEMLAKNDEARRRRGA